MKSLLILVALIVAAPAQAECKYIYVDNKAYWVCDNRSSQQRCGYVYIENKAHWVCTQ